MIKVTVTLTAPEMFAAHEGDTVTMLLGGVPWVGTLGPVDFDYSLGHPVAAHAVAHMDRRPR